MYNTIPHAVIDLPKAEVHIKHPLRNEVSHNLLLDYIRPRLQSGREARDQRLPRMVRADKSIAGWMKMSEDDRERVRKEERDGIPQAVTMNLPLSFVQIDDMMTYYSQTFSPNRGMFYQMGKPDEKGSANQIVTLMNNHAIYAGYYRHVLQTTFSTLKYNVGGFFAEWATDYGPKLSVDSQGKTAVTNNQIIWSGNKVESLDMYNTFWDPMVNPATVYKDGEWCARTKLVSHYWLQQQAARGIYFNVREALDNDNGVATSTYYRSPPAEARLGVDGSTGSDTNWVAFLSNNDGYAGATGFELTEMYVKLNPVQLNLVPRTRENIASRNQYEIWRITLLNDTTIIDTTLMNNMHGFLPFFMGLLHDDGMGISSKSVAEILKPLQDFASFLMNTHVRATRKNIWGLTVYDKTMVDLSEIPEGEVAARVAAKPAATGKDLRNAVVSLADHQLDTKQTMQDLASTMEIINQFFPTTSLPSQIASIDRAVDSQVAAVQQGANRRMQKGARLLDELMFRPLRFALYYNIIQYQQDDAVVTDFYGREVKIDLQQVRATDLPFIIGQGLKAIDRQAAASQLQNIIFALVQNPATADRVDFMGMIDYWTSMIDVDIDMKQFAIQPQVPGMGHNGAPPGPLPGDEGAATPVPPTE